MALDLNTLNPAQKEAVMTTEGPLLVLAGAGSGKTRVLTYRIAHMLEDLNVPPWEILAITFTNKAAHEMHDRLIDLVGPVARGMWVSTFHKCCGRIIRANAELLGFTENYTIYDTDDQKRLVKAILSDFNYEEKRFPAKSVLGLISAAKNNLEFPEDFATFAGNPLEKTTAEVYAEYQKRLKNANALDFDDMLLYAYVLLRDHEPVRRAYQNRFRYILVDEYQDTNRVQYEICKLLAAAHKNLMVVGDDDQSIYSWRGADITNILDFEKDYENCKVVKLEENYRSTGNILNAANQVIAKNVKRKQKKLYTSGEDGELIGIYFASDERDEGRWIAGEIDKSIRKKEIATHDEVAVLYRTNAQSRVLEDMFLRCGVPYRIVGGTKFFERKEIRDAMAYLTLVVNNTDDVAFERIVNVPKRGIGNSTIEKIRQEAASLQCCELVAAESLVASGFLRPAVSKSLGEFVQFIKDASNYKGELKNVVDNIIAKSGLIEELEAQQTDDARDRIENLKELLSVVEEFSESRDTQEEQYVAPTAEGDGEGEVALAKPGAELPDFIEWVRLRTDLDAEAAGEHCVTLMTIHAAKGLEFSHVYVAGMEEGIFPNMTMGKDDDDLEEERRLAYVAITRAKKRLILTHAQQRRLYGMTDQNPASRFLTDIPSELRENLGIGSSGFEGSGWEKRGSRRGISGSGTSYYNSGRVSNIS
ncbi:MAG: UvrD-helicase domain-containing protein, partial [Phoenicibacter congonensis]|nr:UvrD-helicase domain-containing protein [Phoenicibacter congonensis]